MIVWYLPATKFELFDGATIESVDREDDVNVLFLPSDVLVAAE